MKAKAEAEAKEMQAQGLKRGEDFVDCELNNAFFVSFYLFFFLSSFSCAAAPLE